MDPNETYRQWFLALLEERADDAREHYEALRAWFGKGGFEPKIFETCPHARRQFFQFNTQTGRLG